jgi:hypothetical protein
MPVKKFYGINLKKLHIEPYNIGTLTLMLILYLSKTGTDNETVKTKRY